MKNLSVMALSIFTAFAIAACGSNSAANNKSAADMPEKVSTAATDMNIIIRLGEKELRATLLDNDAARDLYSRLPLHVKLMDFNNVTEKIFYPESDINIGNTPRGVAPEPGDICIYVPWGNVCIFCKSWNNSNDLIKIGHISGDGIKSLSVDGNLDVIIQPSGKNH